MSLGANRDYKTSDRRARRNLEAHGIRMAELIAQGLDPVAASKQAFDDVIHPIQRFESQARAAVEQGKREIDFVMNFPPDSDERRAARKTFRKVKKELAAKVKTVTSNSSPDDFSVLTDFLEKP